MFITEAAIQVGRTYRAVKPASTGMFSALFNDRTIIWISSDRAFVQYDGPGVPDGRHYPKAKMEEFCRWALRDVTDELPTDEWQSMTYETMKAESQKRRAIMKAAGQKGSPFSEGAAA